MTGEMIKSEVTRECYPLYFACADLIPGATVEPFDHYQGPYINVPNRGRFFLSTDDGAIGQWYDEARDELSCEFLFYMEDDWAEQCFVDLIETGGNPVPDEMR